MAIGFTDFRLDDAVITKLTIEGAATRVTVKTWREEQETLVFDDALGIECIAVMNESIHHGVESTDDEFFKRCCAEAKESASEFRCFIFVSAWTNAPILKVVARSFDCVRPSPGPSEA